MIDVTSSDDDNVFTSEVGSTVLLKHFDGNVLNVISITTDWLSHLMVSESVVMASFNCGIELLLGEALKLGRLFLLSDFELSTVNGRVCNDISDKRDSTAQISFEAGEINACNFSVSLSLNSSAHLLNLL